MAMFFSDGPSDAGAGKRKRYLLSGSGGLRRYLLTALKPYKIDRRTMVSIWLIILVGCRVVPTCPLFADDTIELQNLFSDPKAFEILAGTVGESCSICVSKSLKNAFSLLNDKFEPGKIVSTSETCLFEKTKAADQYELEASCYSKISESKGYPLLTFRYHTDSDKMVGISSSDLTENHIASEYNTQQPGFFTGKIKIVDFSYGDGDSFNYLPNAHHLQIHCKVLSLERTAFEK